MGSTSLTTSSKTCLDINISSAFLELSINTWHLWQKIHSVSANLPFFTDIYITILQKVHRRKVHAPYLFRNRTGYSLIIWSEQPGVVSEIKLIEIKHGEDIEWRYDDWRRMREDLNPVENKISIQLVGEPFQAVKGVTTDKEGTFNYFLKPKLKEMTYRLICHVKLRNNVKIVTFRSPFYLQNSCDIPIDVCVVKSEKLGRQAVRTLATIGKSFYSMLMLFSITFGPDSGRNWYVPLPLAYTEKLKIRPQG
jgi:vacuolar protein sorting-associated protein 13A/C